MIFVFLTFSLAWWDTGHRIIAMIAEMDLTPRQIQWMTDLFALWPGEEATFVSASTWQDDIKGQGYRIYPMGTWHYSDVPYIPDATAQVTIPPPMYNVTQILRESIDTIMDETTTSSWTLSFAMRNLIHFVADCHCPMHAVALFNSDFPTGDAGGNGFTLSKTVFGNNGGNLHKVWDSGGFSYQTAWPKSDLDYNVSRLLGENPKSKFTSEIANLDPYKWIYETWAVASGYAYINITQNSTPSEEYLQGARKLSEKQFALSGYRLGAIMKNFFDKRGLVKLEQPTWSVVKNRGIIREIVAWVLVLASVVVMVVVRFIDVCKRRDDSPKYDDESVNENLNK